MEKTFGIRSSPVEGRKPAPRPEREPNGPARR